MNTITSQDDQEKKDMETAQKLKPLLGNFLAKEQYNTAEKNAKENKRISDEKLSLEEVKLQCVRLSMRSFFDLKHWEKYPSPLEMAWISGRTSDGRALTREEMEIERNLDLGGFSSFLLNEYYNNKDIIRRGEYPHPLLEKNLGWFWEKMVNDLRITIQVDLKRQASGNQGAIIA